jgi:hypothetical protein
MTVAERSALHELEATEQAVRRAWAARETARERFEAVTRRESRRERTRAHLRVVQQPGEAYRRFPAPHPQTRRLTQPC